MKRKLLLALIGITLLRLMPALAEVRPNISIMMADDMGFSDIGCYGSEISTWELFDLEADRTETNDLSSVEPERVQQMARQ